MDKNYDMKEFAPLFVDKDKATRIFSEIMALDPKNNMITVDLTGIISMTTICAKLIFGRLYKILGADVYHRNVHFIGKSEGVDLVIKMGIASALLDDFV